MIIIYTLFVFLSLKIAQISYTIDLYTEWNPKQCELDPK